MTVEFNARTDCDRRTSPTGECMSVVDGLGDYCIGSCLDTRTLSTLNEIGVHEDGSVDGPKLSFAIDTAFGMLELFADGEKA